MVVRNIKKERDIRKRTLATPTTQSGRNEDEMILRKSAVYTAESFTQSVRRLIRNRCKKKIRKERKKKEMDHEDHGDLRDAVRTERERDDLA
jgi:hypothetical protein